MPKLFLVYRNPFATVQECIKLIVAENKNQAISKHHLTENGKESRYFYAKEINEVDGYDVVLKSKIN